MFGADTPLVMEALGLAAAVAAVGIAGTIAVFKLRSRPKTAEPTAPKTDLEQRVRVLERIATDQAQDLSDEIEQLREQTVSEGKA